MPTSKLAVPAGAVSSTAVVPVLWTPRETADYLGISEKKLEMDRWRGATIPYVKVGRHVRYRAADVLAYVERNLHQVVAG